MGICRLLTYLEQNSHHVMERIDLIAKAKELNGLELLMNFHNFQQNIYSDFMQSSKENCEHEIFRIGSGEYSLIYEWFKKFATDLKQHKISLVIFVDPCRGSRVHDFKDSSKLYKLRQEKNMNKIQEYLNFCKSGINSLEPIGDFETRPVLVTMQILAGLVDAGSELIQCSTERLDYTIAEEFRRRKSFAILSNDNEFAIFQGSAFVPSFGFDLENDLRGQPGRILPQTPKKLVIGIIRNEFVMKFLQFQSYSQLIDFCIVAGNEFTQEINYDKRLWGTLEICRSNIRRNDIETIVRFIKDCPGGSLNNVGKYRDFLERNPDAAKAHDYSRRFYSLRLNHGAVEEDDTCPLFRFIVQEVSASRLGYNLVGMHLGCYWQRNLVEDMSLPSSDSLLVGLREQIYSLILPRESDCNVHFNRDSKTPSVFEYTRPNHHIDQIGVQVFPNPDGVRNYPTADKIDKSQKNLNGNCIMFQTIMTHKETSDVEIDYIGTYGMRQGSIGLCIRYLIRQNESIPKMRLSRSELKAVASAVFWALFDEHTEEEAYFYYRLNNIPSVRCCTLWNWLQNIYFHMKAFLAPLFGLEDDVPQPRDVFCSSVFFAFFQLGLQDPNAGDYHSTESQDQVAQVRNKLEQTSLRCDSFTRDLADGIQFD